MIAHFPSCIPGLPRLLALLVLALSLPVAADARLGETRQQCIDRYGQPLAEPDHPHPASPPLSGAQPDAVFTVGDFRVHTWFNSVGVCDRIAYWHVARAGETDPPVSSLQRRELVHMLEINLAPDQSWTPIDGFRPVERNPDVEVQEEDYSWWRRSFAPETIPESPVAEEYSWWRRTFAPETLPGYVPPQDTGVRIPTPVEEPPLVDRGPAHLAPNHDLAWITPEGSRFAIYNAEFGVMQILTRDSARRLNLRDEDDENLRGL